jgi:hypothetical protein
MALRFFSTPLCALALCLALSGCAASTANKPIVWKSHEASLENYKTFEIWPVFNATERPLNPAVTEALTAHLKERFIANQLEVVAIPGSVSGVLVVQSDLLEYLPTVHTNSSMSVWTPGWTRARCTLRARLVDKSNSQVVAQIVSAKEVNAGDPGTALGQGNKAHEFILSVVAAEIAAETARLMSTSTGDAR